MRILPALVATSLFLLGAPLMAQAQDADVDTQRTTTMSDDDGSGKMGLLGLLGLAGLLGLRRRDREDTVVRRDNIATPRL
jgi:MYXO-CTERM domain-containing protein